MSLDMDCALKLIDDDKARSPEVRARLAAVAKIGAQLRSAHVVDVFDNDEWQGTPFLVMEYLEGEELRARLKRAGALDPVTTYRIAAHAARALARAHAAGIVHRTLSPKKLFLNRVDGEEVVKVMGFALQSGLSTRDDLATYRLLGEPHYMSPEQVRGKASDYRSDLWSLAVVVFECLAGQRPFESDALGELAGMILYDPLPRLSEARPWLPAALDGWWERAAARDREQRFQSAPELVTALGKALAIPTPISVPGLSPRLAPPSWALQEQVSSADSDAAVLAKPERPGLLQRWFGMRREAEGPARVGSVDLGEDMPYEGRDAFDFVSYSRADRHRVEVHLRRLHSLGHRLWYDAGIHASDEWAKVIEAKIHACRTFMVFLTRDAIESKWVRREIHLADSLGKRIVPVKLEEVALRDGLRLILEPLQIIDAAGHDLAAHLRAASRGS